LVDQYSINSIITPASKHVKDCHSGLDPESSPLLDSRFRGNDPFETYDCRSNNFKEIRTVFHQGLVHPWPYRIVRIALAALFIYAGVIKLYDASKPDPHWDGCVLSQPIPAGPGISLKSIEGGFQ
jgi:hypothetical protein